MSTRDQLAAPLKQLDESDRLAREVIEARAERRDALGAQKAALQRGTTATGWQKATARAKASRDSLDAALAAWRADNPIATRLKLNAVARAAVALVRDAETTDPFDMVKWPELGALREALEALLPTEATEGDDDE